MLRDSSETDLDADFLERIEVALMREVERQLSHQVGIAFLAAHEGVCWRM